PTRSRRPWLCGSRGRRGQEHQGRGMAAAPGRLLGAETQTGGCAPMTSPAEASVSLADFKALYRAYVNVLECSRDRIRDLGGDCDSVQKMEAGDPALVRARKVIGEAR